MDNACITCSRCDFFATNQNTQADITVSDATAHEANRDSPANSQTTTSVRPDINTSSLFVSEEVVNEIKANLDENAENFYETDVLLDFGHVVPAYYVMGIDKDNPPNTLLETLVFADRYILPVTDTQGEIIAIAELEELAGKWTVAMSMEIDEDGLREITDAIQKAQEYTTQDNGPVLFFGKTRLR